MTTNPKDKIQKKPLATIGTDIPSVLPSVSVTVGGSSNVSYGMNNLIGKEVSINLKRNAVWGTGPIWLTSKNYWCTIPEGMTMQEYDMISKALSGGELILGKQFIPPIDRKELVLEEYWTAIEVKGFETKVSRDMFARLLRVGVDRGYSAKEIATYCIQRETKRKNRKEVLRLLNQILDHHDSPVTMWEPPDEEEGVKKVIIKADGTSVTELNNGTKIETIPVAKKPDSIKGGTKKPTDILNSIE